MDMDIENNYDMKKKYICENIVKITNHKNYLDIVKFYDCPHTNNSNGFFLNLNTVNDNVIDKFYYKLRNEIEDKVFSNNIIEKQIIEEEIEELLKDTKGTITKEVYDIIKMDDFTEEEKERVGLILL